MHPYIYIKATDNGESLLSLCCGIGLELERLNTDDITAVDIAPQYIARLSDNIRGICKDALEYTKSQPDYSVDIISIIDGIEHLEKARGLELIKEMKRVVRQKVLLFTPEGYLRNEPHNAWDIEGADEHQTHKSGWSKLELKDLGFQLLEEQRNVSQHGESFNETMYIYEKDKNVLNNRTD